MNQTSSIPSSEAAIGRRLFWVFVILASLIHGSLFWLDEAGEPRRLAGDEVRYSQEVKTLRAGGTFEPDPLWPPLYSRFLALFGDQNRFLFVRIVQSLLLAAASLLLWSLTSSLSQSRLAGLVAGGLLFCHPPVVGFAHFLWPEILHLFFLTAALFLLVHKRTGSAAVIALLSAGVLLGLTSLTKSILLPFLPILLLPLLERESWRRSCARVLCVLVGVAVAIAPTAISNLQRDNGVIIANSSTFNLWVGLNDRSRQEFVEPIVHEEMLAYRASGETHRERNSQLRHKIAQTVASRGVFRVLSDQLARQYFRLLDKDSFLIHMLPGGALAASLQGYPDRPASLVAWVRSASYVSYATILLTATLGVWLTAGRFVVATDMPDAHSRDHGRRAPDDRRHKAPTRSRAWLSVALLFLVYNFVLFLFLHTKTRYRIAMLPFCLMFSGTGVAWMASRAGLRLDNQTLAMLNLPAARIVGFLACVLMLLFFALGG